MISGFLIIDKPAGCTSHDVVSFVRKWCGTRKAGHTGTLDPFATGVLPVAVGEATKAIPFLDESVKEYRAVMRLGETTDSGDATGTVTRVRDWRQVDAVAIQAAAQHFTGTISQIPPMHSALKRNGVPLYKLARRGETVEREPRMVTIHSLLFEEEHLPEICFTVRCSRGTYVRTLAEDIGEELGCGAHLVSLRRIASGPFRIDAALSLESVATSASCGEIATRFVTSSSALGHLDDIALSDPGALRVSHGNPPGSGDFLSGSDESGEDGTMVRLSHQGRLAAVGQWSHGTLRLLRVFN